MGEQREPALDLVEPRRISRCVMDMEARSCSKPGADFGMLVRGIVVDHQMSVEVRRDIRLDVLECQPARKTDPLSASNIDPTFG